MLWETFQRKPVTAVEECLNQKSPGQPGMVRLTVIPALKKLRQEDCKFKA
jgi:hypothetical protein